jgi:hypothetical protein
MMATMTEVASILAPSVATSVSEKRECGLAVRSTLSGFPPASFSIRRFFVDAANLSEFEQSTSSPNRYQRLIYSRALILSRKPAVPEAAGRGGDLSDEAPELAAAKSTAGLIRESH